MRARLTTKVETPLRTFYPGLLVHIKKDLGGDNFLVFNFSAGQYFEVSGDELKFEEESEVEG